MGGGGLKLGIYYAFFSNFLCLPFSFKPSSPINNCMQIFYGSVVLGGGGAADCKVCFVRREYSVIALFMRGHGLRGYAGHGVNTCVSQPISGS